MKMERNAHTYSPPLSAQELKPTELEILKALAKNGASTGYALIKQRKKGERSVYPALHGLQAKAYVKCRVIGKTRAGLPKEEYSLTFWGLCNSLCLLEGKADVLSCARKWGCLDEVVLSNVDSLKEAFGVDEVCEALKYAASEIAHAVYVNEGGARIGEAPYMLDFFRSSFFNRLVNPVRLWEIEKHASKWKLAVNVKAWLLKWLQRRKESALLEADWIDRFLKCLEGAEEGSSKNLRGKADSQWRGVK